MTDVRDSARKVADSDAMSWGARAGLTARALIYLLIGGLAVAVALGKSRSETDQRGALNAVAGHSGGKVLLVLLAVGFAGYALWRLSEAAFGVAGEGNGKGARLKSLVRGLVYAFFAVTTVTILTGSGSGKSQGSQQQDITAKTMEHSGGRLLVGLVGVIIVVVGLAMVYEGATRKFEKFLRMSEMSATTRSVVEKLGMVGTIARGAVFALAGVLVVDAARSFKPEKARGVDGALRTLAEQSHGQVLLVVAAIGLLIFGLYGFAEARWHKT
ncbi:MAG: hypothetical protein JWL64_1011 [Frankiales bacterium]|nr:hypothetical protein [Frankiales bacterium]